MPQPMTRRPDPNTPVLIGASQMTFRGAPESCPNALGLLETVSRGAGVDAGLDHGALTGLDGIGVVGFTVDAPGLMQSMPLPRLKNAPLCLASVLGADPHRKVYTHMGGNTPQSLVNHFAEEIAQGRNAFVLLAGAEFLGALMKLFRAGADMSGWADPDPDAPDPERFGDPRDGCSAIEDAHGLGFPANVYPLFENAYRNRLGRSLDAHMASVGRLFAPFTDVAATNPHAWFPIARSAEELITPSPKNRMVGFPYTKYLNAIIQVDQAAAVIMTSVAKAEALGVPQDKWVFLHGCSDVTELWDPLDRVDYASSPAIRFGARAAFKMAGKTPADLAFMDLYSCFPIAVELACAEIGIAQDDPRGLTLTGGLPYFGGPGNNYSMHAIVEAVGRARAEPGALGLVTANGWYLTKHAFGLYATTPTEGLWVRAPIAAVQAEVDALSGPERVSEPDGAAVIETFTVIHEHDAVRMAIIIGRDAKGRRFVANTPRDESIYRWLETADPIGASGHVVTRKDGGKAIFTPDMG